MSSELVAASGTISLYHNNGAYALCGNAPALYGYSVSPTAEGRFKLDYMLSGLGVKLHDASQIKLRVEDGPPISRRAMDLADNIIIEWNKMFFGTRVPMDLASKVLPEFSITLSASAVLAYWPEAHARPMQRGVEVHEINVPAFTKLDRRHRQLNAHTKFLAALNSKKVASGYAYSASTTAAEGYLFGRPLAETAQKIVSASDSERSVVLPRVALTARLLCLNKTFTVPYLIAR